MWTIYRMGSVVFDALEGFWEQLRKRRVVGNVLVLSFVGTLGVVELRRQGWLPASLSDFVPTSHFAAVNLAFTLLLVAEVIWLVFGLASSVSNAVGRQFEILSLILLRESFEEFAFFSEPLAWPEVSEAILEMGMHAVGALLIFVALGFYYRTQRHLPITKDEVDQTSFVAAKKMIAVLLLVSFALIAFGNARSYLMHREVASFFDVFFTVLIFSDILIVLISLRYSDTYHVAFRNSGFAVATVFIRLALIAPRYVDVLLGLGAALFALGLTLAYNAFAPILREKDPRATSAASD
jgi:hypothetical protein